MEILISTVNGRTDRDDINLQELVFAEKWKLAIVNIERRLKKVKTDRLLVNKAILQMRMPDNPDRVYQGRKELLDLMRRKPPLGDIDILVFLDATLDPLEHGVPDEIVGMWERAIIAYPANAALLAGTWFERRFFSGDWKVAKKAALLASRHSQDKRRYLFSQVICHHIYSGLGLLYTTEESKKDRDLSRMIAYRLLSKAVADTPRDDELAEGMKGISLADTTATQQARLLGQPNALSPTIQTSCDIEFVVQVYTVQERFQEALAVLENNQRTDLDSMIGSGNWDLVREKIKLLQKCGKWMGLYSLCTNLIADATAELLNVTMYEPKMKFGATGDDWLVWKALIRATSEIRTEIDLDAIYGTIDAFKKINLRSYCLASLEWWLHKLPTKEDPTKGIMGLGFGTFAKLLTKPSTFRDISNYVEALPGPEKITFVHKVSDVVTNVVGEIPQDVESDSRLERQRQWVAAEINSLKLDYTLVVSRRERLESTPLMEAFVTNCLRLWALSLTLDQDGHTVTDRRCGDDAAILAATGCIRLYGQQRQKGLLRASLILEELLFYSPHNYEAQLLLIQTYISHGAATRAFQHYTRLDIKNLQHLSLYWVLFTRISTLHPLPSTVLEFSAGEEAKSAWTAIDRIRVNVKSSLEKFLKAGAYRNLLGQLEVKRFCDCSTAYIILNLEHWRMAWLGGVKSPEKFPADIIGCEQWIFTRDTLGLPNYEPEGQPSIDNYIGAGPAPHKPWVELQMLIGNLRLAFFRSRGLSLEAFQNAPFLQQQIERETGTETNLSDHTPAEMKMRNFSSLMFKIMKRFLQFHEETSRLNAAKETVQRRSSTGRKEEVSNKAVAKIMDERQSDIQSDLDRFAPDFRNWFVFREFFEWYARVSLPTSEAILLDWTFFHGFYMRMEAMTMLVTFFELVSVMDKKSPRHIYGRDVLQRKVAEIREEIREYLRRYHEGASGLLKWFAATGSAKELVKYALAGDATNEGEDEIAREMRRVLNRDRLRKSCVELTESWRSGLECLLQVAGLKLSMD